MKKFTISELVRRTNVPASSIHHYLRLGLLPAPKRSATNKFLYDDRHSRVLTAIRTLRQESQMSLEQIRLLLPELLKTPQRAAQIAADTADPQEHAKKTLLDAAIQAFSEHSYGEVSIADISERAGLAKGTFYLHFDSKRTVFLAAAEEVGNRAADNFKELIADIAEPTQQQAGELFARCLRSGLPVFLELAKRAVQEEPEHVEEARQVFHSLADRIGRSMVDSPDAYRHGGAVILDAIAHVFYDLVSGMGGAARD